ncbi:MAG TPA: CBS domain-containing protein [Coxiellaceae bacterium]|nr:CBS domain-containing protein [Coxiellaceae bacterium]
MSIKSIMNTSVVFMPKNASVQEAARKMRDENVGTIVVVNNGNAKEACGILTDRDVALFLAKNTSIDGISINELMSYPLITLNADQGIKELCLTMAESQVRRVVIMDEQNFVQGIASMDDLFLLLAGEMSDIKQAVESQANKQQETLP